MGRFAAGRVAVLPFSFSDLSRNKYRPALLLADVGRGDWIACQSTSNHYTDSRAVEISPADFAAGSLMRTSFARPGKLFTANEDLFASVAATVRVEKLPETRSAMISLLTDAPQARWEDFLEHIVGGMGQGQRVHAGGADACRRAKVTKLGPRVTNPKPIDDAGAAVLTTNSELPRYSDLVTHATRRDLTPKRAKRTRGSKEPRCRFLTSLWTSWSRIM